MSTLLLVLTAVFHLVIPLGVAVLLAARPARSKVSRGLGLFALLGYVGFLFIAGAGWGMLGQPSRLLVATVVPVLAVVGVLRARKARNWPVGVRAWLATAAAGLFAVLTLSPYPSLAGTWSQPAGAVGLASPLEQGRYLVIHGGNDEVLNHHARGRSATPWTSSPSTRGDSGPPGPCPRRFRTTGSSGSGCSHRVMAPSWMFERILRTSLRPAVTGVSLRATTSCFTVPGPASPWCWRI